MQFIPIASSSKGNAYLVKSAGVAPLLLECGISIGILREKLDFGLSGLAGCLVSHRHGDHCKSVKDCLKAGVDIWISEDAAKDLGIIEHHRTNILRHGQVVTIGGWIVLPFDLQHDVTCQGFLIANSEGEKILFIPDTGYIRHRFGGVNILAVECNHLEEILTDKLEHHGIPTKLGQRIRKSHMSLERVIEMLKANDLSGCREVWLLHLSDTNSNERTMIRRVQEATGVPVYAAK
jgi:phosphoribosyl 1,2-cyclic phosphodiesterase